ncbi:hypothetical protein EX30DRAFT_45960 [Ascodesmis nigricans]|uniref:Uncharacterized protein n=1 Tax=Ascodesmis nigricans TaxID=341454 RepID=A0A4S2MVH7_9PEZI|nr:hypothetical protein EX30DRAFT_45960 [Ascodesmis nigricans]
MPQAPLKSKPLATGKNGKTKIVRYGPQIPGIWSFPLIVSRNAGVTKRGARTIAPKAGKRGGQRAEMAKLQKKLSAQLTDGTEKRLAAKAGHLELLAGGKKDKKKEEAKK